MEQWIPDFNAKCGANLNPYGGGGSGKGIADFIANQVDFAGSDSALKADQAAAAKSQPVRRQRRDQPADGDRADRVGLQPVRRRQADPDRRACWRRSSTARSPTGTTRRSPRSNPGVDAARPGDPVGAPRRGLRHHRELHQVPRPPRPAPGRSTRRSRGPRRAASPRRAADGVSKQIASTDGSIGYVEWGFAQDDGLSVAQIDNGGGAVELTAESAGKAVAAATVAGTGKDLALKLDYATKDAGRLPGHPGHLRDRLLGRQRRQAARCSSRSWATPPTDGQAALDGLGAAPLPAEIQTKVDRLGPGDQLRLGGAADRCPATARPLAGSGRPVRRRPTGGRPLVGRRP